MNEILNSFLLVFAGLFPIINPVGSAPLFLGLTRHCNDTERHILAKRVAVNGFFLLLGALIVGSHVLQFFGITLPVVRIAGGLVVTSFGWKLLHAEDDVGTDGSVDPKGGLIKPSDSFYPLTMPLTVGPGSISVAIALGSQRPRGSGLGELLIDGSGAVAGLVAIAATVFVCYRFAERIVIALGEHGTRVLVRLSAFVLLCIGIQILWSGYTALRGIGS